MNAPVLQADVTRAAELIELAAVTRHLLESNQDLAGRVALTLLRPIDSKVTIALLGVEESLADLARWAERHGGVLQADTRHWAGTGVPYRACSVRFEVAHFGVEITANLPVILDQTIPLMGDCP